MAWEIPGHSWSRPAGADLSAKSDRFVNLNSDGEAVLPAAGGDIVGVCRQGAEENRAVAIVSDGEVRVLCGGTIANNAYVTTDTDGRAVTATTGDLVHGRALAAGVNNQYITVQLRQLTAESA